VIFPEDTLGKKYVVTSPIYADGATGTPSVIRVAAVADNTQVTFDPSDVHAPATLAAGAFLEVSLAAARNTVISANQPLLVAQYMVGSQALGQMNGDPSQSAAVPVEQFRKDYLFTAPLTYNVNLATIIAKPGTAVSVDGVPVPAGTFVAVGSGEYVTATVTLEGDLSDPNSAVHKVSADKAVGLSVYGYGLYTSYMYPGGADLARIAIPILL